MHGEKGIMPMELYESDEVNGELLSGSLFLKPGGSG